MQSIGLLAFRYTAGQLPQTNNGLLDLNPTAAGETFPITQLTHGRIRRGFNKIARYTSLNTTST